MREYSGFTLKTIMLATDLSPASYGASGYAQELARQFSAKVLLTHVIDPTLLTSSQKSNLCDTIDCAERELQERTLSLDEDSIESRVIVRQGSIRETILNLIVERNVDLLVIGTKGQSFKPGDQLGSVAEKLLRAMPCPVLTVCMNARTGAFDGTHQQRILFPTDFSKAARFALGYAECLAHRLRGHLFLLHVEDGTAASPIMKLNEETAKFKALSDGMKEPSLVAEYITCTGSPAERIAAAAAEKDVNLIVMRVHEGDQPAGSRLHGVAYDVIRLARCPVFTLFVSSQQEEALNEEAVQTH